MLHTNFLFAVLNNQLAKQSIHPLPTITLATQKTFNTQPSIKLHTRIHLLDLVAIQSYTSYSKNNK